MFKKRLKARDPMRAQLQARTKEQLVRLALDMKIPITGKTYTKPELVYMLSRRMCDDLSDKPAKQIKPKTYAYQQYQKWELIEVLDEGKWVLRRFVCILDQGLVRVATVNGISELPKLYYLKDIRRPGPDAEWEDKS